MPVYELRQNDCLVSTDRAQLDISYIAALLSRTYWAQNRCSEKQVLRSCENSFCFGLYENGKQIGFARVITDHVFFGYLCDVCVDEKHRGRGLGKLLVRAVVECPELKGLKIMLATPRRAACTSSSAGPRLPLLKPCWNLDQKNRRFCENNVVSH